ncbi:MAG: aminoacetone oxidase family FAD-binding enzyme [Lachnospiraceae bacterium]|nr:aminoacetone oxidase family FAD-binding enzyme [Lachnospiraceae bacterium]
MPANVIVIGAGASGLMAAISAARSGAAVTVLEAQERAGRKLLITGNGRCNLTSPDPEMAKKYQGTGAGLAMRLTGEFGNEATLDFFHSLGLLTREKNGCVYPYTMRASSVLDVLLAEARSLRVKLKFSQKITEVIPAGAAQPDRLAQADAGGSLPNGADDAVPHYQVVTPTWTYTADSVILACGSKAAPATGAASEGYLLAESLGHSIIEPRPVLVPLVCEKHFLEKSLAGMRCHAKVTLLYSASGFWTDRATEELASETGELQWTNYGVSGIVIFGLSRYADFGRFSSDRSPAAAQASAKGTKNRIHYVLSIDFLPDFNERELEELLIKRAGGLSKEPVSVLLRGFLNEKLIPLVLSHAGQGHPPVYCLEMTEEFIKELVTVMKMYHLPVFGTKSFDQAQVCAGGVDCAGVTEKLESRLHKSLYFAGEMLDVDGPCGGYNLQWAWTSGYLAGKNAAKPQTGRKQK